MAARIEVDAALPSHRKSLTVKALCGLSNLELVGGLALFWLAVRQHEPDGNVSAWTDQQIGLAAGFVDVSAAATFGAALRSAGFIDPDGMVHDWPDHSGRRSKAAIWKRNQRIRKAMSTGLSTGHARTVRDSQGLSTNVSVGVRVLESGGESREESKSTHLVAPATERRSGRSGSVKPTPTYPEGFERFWEGYAGVRRKNKPEAAKFWRQLGCEGFAETVLAGLEAFRQTEQWATGFMPEPARWLKNRGWEDDHVPIKPAIDPIDAWLAKGGEA